MIFKIFSMYIKNGVQIEMSLLIVRTTNKNSIMKDKKIRAEINKLENRQKVEKSHKSKCFVF